MKSEPSPRNMRTFLSPAQPLDDGGELMARAFAVVEERMRAAGEGEGGGYVLAGVDPDSGEASIIGLEPGSPGEIASAVFGRHDAVDLRLFRDSAISLRHLIVMVSRNEEGELSARVLDLRSGSGLTDMNGTPHYGLAADGPLALRVGNSAMFAVPRSVLAEKRRCDDLFDAIEWPAPVPWSRREAPERNLRDNRRTNGRSSVITMSRPSPLTPAGPTGTEGRGPGIIVLETERESYRFAPDERSLLAGLLVGRYPRCDLSLREAELPATLSRVHALFISIDDRVHVFDLASTNGVLTEGFTVRSMALPPHQPTTLELGDAIFTWWPGNQA